MSFLKPLSHSILLPIVDPIAPTGAPTISVEYTASSEIVVSAPPEFAGTYTVTISDVANGPATIVAPRVVGSATVGQTLSLEPGLYAHGSSEGAPVASIQWMRGGTAISGETGSTHSVTSTDLSDGLAVRVTVTNADGAISDTIDVATASVVQPVLASPLPNVSFEHNTGDQSVDASTAFTGDALTYSVEGSSATIDPTTGEITHTTTNLMAPTPITVSATNSAGTVQTIYSVAVVPAAPQVLRTIDDQSWIEGQGTKEVDTSVAFSGTHLTYSVSGAGVSIDPGSGIATHATDVVGAGNTITVTATNASGSVSTSYNASVSRAAPVVVDTLPDRNYSVSSGTHTFDASVAFSGSNLTFSVQGPGVSIDRSTGILAHQTDSAITGTVTVSAANEAGSADAVYQLAITEDGYDVIDNIPDITVSLVDNGDGTHIATITGNESDYTSRSPVVVLDADLAAGLPINLVPPIVTEGPANTFAVKSGLWISPSNDPAVFTLEWYENDAATGNSDNPYTNSNQTTIAVRETAVNVAGTTYVDTDARTVIVPHTGIDETWSQLTTTDTEATIVVDADGAPYTPEDEAWVTFEMTADADSPTGKALNHNAWFLLDNINTQIASGWTHLLFDYRVKAIETTLVWPAIEFLDNGSVIAKNELRGGADDAKWYMIHNVDGAETSKNITHGGEVVRAVGGIRSSDGTAYMWTDLYDANDVLIRQKTQAYASAFAADQVRYASSLDRFMHLHNLKVDVYDQPTGTHPAGWPTEV